MYECRNAPKNIRHWCSIFLDIDTEVLLQPLRVQKQRLFVSQEGLWHRRNWRNNIGATKSTIGHKVHPCIGTEAQNRPYGSQGG